MRVQVQTDVGHGGVEMPRRFSLDGREIAVIENLDQWHGADHRYFKVIGDDGGTYILRLDEDRAEWELTLYQRAQSDGARASLDAVRQPRHKVRM